MVGTAGFEPATTTPPVWCATRLRYAPKTADYTGIHNDRESQLTHGNASEETGLLCTFRQARRASERPRRLTYELKEMTFFERRRLVRISRQQSPRQLQIA